MPKLKRCHKLCPSFACIVVTDTDKRIRELEDQGLTTSDAQGVVMAEEMMLELSPEQVHTFGDRMGLLPTMKTVGPEETATRNHNLEARMRRRKV